jgi:5-methylcytosine-specific restriction endonuclease McrA
MKEESRKETTHVPRDNHGRIKRSSSARDGLTRTPPGCQVDHIIPPVKGGADVPANMQLLCGEALREKEATELR